ncbi:uncharacterized protein LOC133205170 [Saccostrea echinata]|uniref:uncharacterized protein LOC133205170 n=1 Tax=Saccostrea echinata TaxID=191078 RepID=UPI002A7FFAAD|nr:uncharacterized protein LOC133205170 [Saccostrea echinata]
MNCDLCILLSYMLRMLCQYDSKLAEQYGTGNQVPVTLDQRLLETKQNTPSRDVENFKWSYGGSTGPDHWPEYFPQCAGRRQSPIHIRTADIQHVTWLPEFQFINYDKLSGDGMQPAFLHLRNNGHTASMAIDDEIYLRGSNLGELYRAVEIHFHWGSENNIGSEHVLDNHHHPLEVHIVHYNTKYATLAEAKKQPDGLVVIGIFADISEEKNHAFELVATALDQVTEYDHKTIVTGLRPIDMLPNDTSRYYHYAGSLTTPPCYESVSWYVMHEGITITQDQINRLRHLKEHVEDKHSPHKPLSVKSAGETQNINNTDNRIVNSLETTDHHSPRTNYIKYNFRPCQPLYGRRVYCSHPSMVKQKSHQSEFSVSDIAVSHHVSNLGDHDVSKALLQDSGFHGSIGSSLSNHPHESHLHGTTLNMHSHESQLPAKRVEIDLGGHKAELHKNTQKSPERTKDVSLGYSNKISDKLFPEELKDVFSKKHIPNFKEKLEPKDIYKIFGRIFLRQAQILTAQKKSTDKGNTVNTQLFNEPEIKEYSNPVYKVKKIETVKNPEQIIRHSHPKRNLPKQKVQKRPNNTVLNSPARNSVSNFKLVNRQKSSGKSFNLASDHRSSYSARRSNQMVNGGFHFSVRQPVYQRKINKQHFYTPSKKNKSTQYQSKSHRSHYSSAKNTHMKSETLDTHMKSETLNTHMKPEGSNTRMKPKTSNGEVKKRNLIDLISENHLDVLDSNFAMNTQNMVSSYTSLAPQVDGSVGFSERMPQLPLKTLGLEETAVFPESVGSGLSNRKSDTMTEKEQRMIKSVLMDRITQSTPEPPLATKSIPEITKGPTRTSKPDMVHEQNQTSKPETTHEPIHHSKTKMTQEPVLIHEPEIGHELIQTSGSETVHEPVQTMLGNEKLRFPIQRERNTTNIPIREILGSHSNMLSILTDPTPTEEKPYLPS